MLSRRGLCGVTPALLASVLCVSTGCSGLGSSSARASLGPTSIPTWEVIGKSREGLSIRAMSLGRPSARHSAPRRVALIAGIHGDEREGGRHLDELLQRLTGYDGSIRIYEDVNPDGTWRGARATSTGVDPNRNWPAQNFEPSPRQGSAPLSEPGVTAAYRDLVKFKPELVIVLHSTGHGPFVNFDGPAEDYAQAFSDAAGPPWTVQPSMGYPTPGSFGSWMGVDNGIPTLTIEFRRGCPEAESQEALMAGMGAALALSLSRPIESD